ncbi:MAG: DMT family transporter [Roseicyclus sp.]|nr:DMT family transporter [Roseicyclus sp.]
MSIKRRLAILTVRWARVPPTLRGIIFMSASTVGFAVMHTLIRYVSAELHPFQIAFFRNVFGILIFIPMLMRHGFAPFKTKRLPLHGLRGVLNIVAMFAFFTALSITPIARVTALSFSAPIFTAVLSVLILGERFRLHRWSAILLGFTGTLVILRPGIIPTDPGSILVLSSAFLWGITMIVIKVLSRTDSAMTITSYMNVMLAFFAFIPALWVWRTPSFETWGWLVIIGLSGTLAQLALTQALKEGETTVVLPFDFLKLIWVSLFGFWLFGEVADLWTWVGAAIIIASAFYMAHREKMVSRPKVPASPLV